MDFTDNNIKNEGNDEQQGVRFQTACFPDLLDKLEQEQTNEQQHPQNLSSPQKKDKIQNDNQDISKNTKLKQDTDNSNNQNNLASYMPSMLQSFLCYMQQAPQQQNEQIQKSEIKTTLIEESKPKPSLQKQKLTLTQQKQKLISKGIDEQYILNGEKYKTEIKACLKTGTSRQEGNLILTNYKIVFIITGKVQNLFSPDFYHIHLMLIQSCERQVEKKGDQYSFIEIQCKDVRKYQFRFNFSQNDESFDFMTKLVEKIFFMENEIKMYPAVYYKKQKDLDKIHNGWNVYNIKKEFERMKLQIYDDQNHNNQDKYLHNEKKEICETYPPLLVVPNNMSDDQIKKCSKFRSKERLPVVTFAYTNNDNQLHTLWRCSQCKTGFTGRSSEDVMMLRYIGDPAMKENKQNINNINVYIYDARPFMNAVGNKFSGKGYESVNDYKNCDIQFLEIHNIHKVRDSFNKVVAVCQSADLQIKWHKEIDQTQWLDYIQTILSGTVRICDSIENHNVLVHCSDGWDRTAQLCSLTQILLDPYYRTIDGFSVLVEKDWIQFGHQFNYRQGHGVRNQSNEFSPVFLQFLDCVHQILNQYPLSFEFNEQFLVDLAFSSYNCIFGTFLMNFYQQLAEKNINKQTNSVWSWIKSRIHLYTNPFYKNDSHVTRLRPDFQQRSLQLWKRFFLYYQPEILDQYLISQNCRFNQDNLQNDYKEALTKIKYYESLLQAVDPEFQKQKVPPHEFAYRIQKNTIETFKQEQKQLQQKIQQEKDEQEYDVLTTSYIQSQSKK